MTEAKTKKQRRRRPARGRPRKRGLPPVAWLAIALAITATVILLRIYPPSLSTPENPAGPRAAIVDQLYNLQPNPAFITGVIGELEDYGFKVDLYQGDDVTVGAYRNLPARGYNLIIFRAHSGILALDGEEIERTVIFTNEPYRQLKYSLEQLHDRLGPARVGEGHPLVFGIPPKFITESMDGRFDDTVIIMMGCSGIYDTDLAAAFIGRGASVYMAWSASVHLDYVDDATLYLVQQLCSADTPTKRAVYNTMMEKGPDRKYDAFLRYYPAAAGDSTLADLISPS